MALSPLLHEALKYYDQALTALEKTKGNCSTPPYLMLEALTQRDGVQLVLDVTVQEIKSEGAIRISRYSRWLTDSSVSEIEL